MRHDAVALCVVAPSVVVVTIAPLAEMPGDCKGYCGVAFCACGSMVNCRNGVFGCGYQEKDPTAECFCDDQCLHEGTCCSNYAAVCLAGAGA